MAITALRGARLPLLMNNPKLPPIATPLRLGKFNGRFGTHSVFARYSQDQDIPTRLQDSFNNLPKLVEDIVQTSISTGPRGALRLAQGIRAVIAVGGEWLNDLSRAAISDFIKKLLLKLSKCLFGFLLV